MANAADEKSIKATEQAWKLKAKQDAEDIRVVMGTPAGRRLIGKVLAHCKVLQSGFHPSGSEMYFRAGMREVGLMLFSELEENCPDLFLVMRQELKKQEESDGRE